MKLSNWIPALEWLPQYNRTLFKSDLIAGLTVGVMLIPQGMAYAIIAGLPPVHGLYASAIPLIIYGLLGTSRQLSVAPVAMVALLSAASLSTLTEMGSGAFIAYSALMALLVGGIQWGMGILRLGFVVNFLSHPVVSGFTSAAALVIGISQLKHVLGVNLAQSHHIHKTLTEAAFRWSEINTYALLISLIGIAMIFYLKKYYKSFPGALLAVIIGSIVGYTLIAAGKAIEIVGEVPGGLPSFTLPAFDASIAYQILPAAIAISLVGFMESIAVAKSIQIKHKDYEVDANKELKALGLANVGTSFFQGFAVTGGFSRSAVNDQAGAKTGMASLLAALVILLTLVFLTGLFYYLPKAILAAVIIVAVSGLIDLKEPLYLWKTNKQDFGMLLTTFLGTLLLGIEEGILIGVVLSLLLIIYRSTRPHYAVLGRVKGTSFFRNIRRFNDLEVRDDTLIIRFDADLFFANIDYFKNAVMKEIQLKGERLKYLILNTESISSIDSSAITALKSMIDELKNRQIVVLLSNVKGPVRDTMERCTFFEVLGPKSFYLSTQAAFDAIHLNALNEEHLNMARQTGVKD